MLLWGLLEVERQRMCIVSKSDFDVLLVYVVFISHKRLLDVLADRKASSRVSGSIFVDGVQRRKDFRFLSGYVVQVRGVGKYCICTGWKLIAVWQSTSNSSANSSANSSST